MKTMKYIFIFTLLAMGLQGMGQTIVYVKSSAAGSNNGTSWANAYTNLRTALTNAPTGAQVWVAAGTYYPASGSSRTQCNIIADKNLTVYGGFPNSGSPGLAQRVPIVYQTIVSGDINQDDAAWDPVTHYNDTTRDDNFYNVFNITATGTTSRTVTLDGLVIQSGNANSTSAGSGRYGGGIYVTKSSNGSSTLNVNLTGCVFRYNTAVYCGAIGAYYLFVTNGTINYNIVRCKFYDNAADAWTVYGHIYAATNAGINGNVYLLNSVAYRNAARLSSGGSGLVYLSCKGNTTSSSIAYHAHFNTFADNTIVGTGGGVICAEGPGNSNGNSELMISNNIFWNNSNKPAVFKSSGTGTAFVQPSGIDYNMTNAADSFIVAGKNNIFGNPKFQGGSSPYRLSPCSPAINSGGLNIYTTPNSYVTITPGTMDVEENSRTQGGTIDRGAFEFFGTASGPSSSTVSAAICPGSTYSFDGQNLSVAGTYRDTLTNILGCDSIITLTLSLKTSSQDTFSATICMSDSFTFNNVKYGTAGFYTVTFTNTNGCDSIRTLNLTVTPLPQPTITRNGASLTANGGPFSSYQWYLNGNSISGATSASFTPVTNGTYKVTVMQSNCTGTSSDFSVGFVGMKEFTLMSGVNFYPNPSNGMVTIETKQPTTIVIMNMLGETLIKETIQSKVILNVQYLPKGIYLIGDAEMNAVSKLVLQ